METALVVVAVVLATTTASLVVLAFSLRARRKKIRTRVSLILRKLRAGSSSVGDNQTYVGKGYTRKQLLDDLDHLLGEA